MELIFSRTDEQNGMSGNPVAQGKQLQHLNQKTGKLNQGNVFQIWNSFALL